MEPQGHPKCQRDSTRPCKVPQRPERHIQTARGRVLAAGDVDPAAGSRDEPTRLHVESPVAERKQGFEVTSSKVLFLTSINWVPPLPPNHEMSSRGHPKRHQKNIEKTKGTHGGPKTENKGPEP